MTTRSRYRVTFSSREVEGDARIMDKKKSCIRRVFLIYIVVYYIVVDAM